MQAPSSFFLSIPIGKYVLLIWALGEVNGLCLVVVRGIPGKTGTIIIEAKSPGLTDARVKV